MSFFLYLGLVFMLIGIAIAAAAILRRKARRAKVERSQKKKEGASAPSSQHPTSGQKTRMHRPLSHGGNLYIFVG